MVPENTGPMTNRQLFEQITSPRECQVCHAAVINPLGFAFENFDNMGRFRTKEGELPINAAASYPFTEGRKDFNGANDLMKIIAESADSHDCYSKGLFGYIFGRDIATDSDADKALVAEISRRSKQSASVKSMILDLVATNSFIFRLP
jgi:hypothetical protein